MSLTIGSRLWLFDQNRRVYPPPKPGQLWSSSAPIYAEHFAPHRITNETRTHWVVGAGTRVRKLDLTSRARGTTQYYFTDEGKADHLWCHEHRHTIVDAVNACHDVAKLKAIAATLGLDLKTA
jgi:hypothetical protein